MSRSDFAFEADREAAEHDREAAEHILFTDGGRLGTHKRSETVRTAYNRAFENAVEVGIGFQVIRIHAIDEAAEQFSIDFDMHMRWSDPSVVDVKEPDWEKAWNPMIIFRNEVDLREISRRIYVSDPSRGVVFAYMKFNAQFYENLELMKFPFDRQILHIDVSSFRPMRELRFVSFDERPNKIFAMPISQWNVLMTHGPDGVATGDKAETIIPKDADLMESADGSKYPRASFEIRVQRDCKFYLWNMVVIAFALVEMSFVVYSMPPTDLADRMGVNLTLVLTIVAFKFTFAGDMPKKAYLTWMDRYLITAFLALVAQTAQCYVAAVLADRDCPRALKWVEHSFQIGIFVPWTLYHIYLALFSDRMYLPWEEVHRQQKVQAIL